MPRKIHRDMPSKGSEYAPEATRNGLPPIARMTNPELSSQTSDTCPSDGTLDTQTLRDLEADISPTALRRIIGLFIDETKTRLVDIAKAQAHGDWQRIRREAHTLTSSAGAFGAKRLEEHARRLDESCISGDWVKTQTLAKSIADVASSAMEALARQYPNSEI